MGNVRGAGFGPPAEKGTAQTILTPSGCAPILPFMSADTTNPSEGPVPSEDAGANPEANPGTGAGPGTGRETPTGAGPPSGGSGSAAGLASVAAYRARYGGLFAVLLALGVIAAHAVTLVALIPSKADLTFPEGALVARAADVAEGLVPYRDWREWPHAFAPYAPLTYYVPGTIARVSGGGSGERSDVQRLYVIGRLQSAAGLLGIAVLMVAIARRLGLGWGWGMAAVAGFLHWRLLTVFCLSYRPDAPAVFFSVLALWIILGGRATWPRVICVFLALMTSMWFKPVSYAMTLVAFVWIARSRALGLAAVALGAYGALGLGAALLLNARFDGFLFSNMLGSLDVGLKIANSSGFFGLAPPTVSVLFLAGIGLASYRAVRDRSDPASGTFHLAAIASYVAMLMLHSRPGADVNYYLEPYVLCVLATVRWVAGLWRAPKSTPAQIKELGFLGLLLPPMIFPALGAGVTLAGLCAVGLGWLGFRRGASLAPASASALREIFLIVGVLPFCLLLGSRDIGLIRTRLEDARLRWHVPSLQREAEQAGGLVLSTLPSVTLAGSGRETLMDHVQFRMLNDRGLVSNREMIDRLESRSFAWIVVPVENETIRLEESLVLLGIFFKGFRFPLLENYEQVRRQGPIAILRPKAEPRK